MPKQVIGPSLPPNWGKDKETGDNSDSEDNQTFGPTLPPNYGSSEEPKPTERQTEHNVRPIGPELVVRKHKPVTNDSDSDSDDMIGPIPESHHNYDKLNQKFGNCSDILATNSAQREMKREREIWMTEVPKSLATKLPTKSVKHFSQRPVKSDDKNASIRHKKDEKRDRELTQIMDSYNKSQKRDTSLIDIHSKESKKSKTNEKKGEERVPFDPEKDLLVRKMDSRQTKSVLNKAKGFNDRFSLGVNKFL